MMQSQKELDWMEKVNAEYQKVIGIIMGLSSATFILPILVLREILRIPESDALIKHFNVLVYAGWLFLLLAILTGVIYHYTSAKWLKHLGGGNVYFSGKKLELILDVSFWLCPIFYILGTLSLIWFIANSMPVG